MQNIVDIKNRIKSIKDIAQITKAMQLISVSKMRKANEKYEHNDRYYRRIKSTIRDILTHSSQIEHPYLKQSKGKGTAFIIIASDAGLAGAYNYRVLEFAEKELSSVSNYRIFSIGYIAEEYLSIKGYKTNNQFIYCTQSPTLDDVRRLSANAIDLFDAGEVDEVKIIYTRQAGGRNVAMSTRLLPIEKSDFNDAKPFAEYKESLTFQPSATDVFNILVPQYVFGLMFNALAESIRCEHNERMIAMNSATNNAEEMIEKLELEYHRARQERITSELSEISSYQRLGNGQKKKKAD